MTIPALKSYGMAWMTLFPSPSRSSSAVHIVLQYRGISAIHRPHSSPGQVKTSGSTPGIITNLSVYGPGRLFDQSCRVQSQVKRHETPTSHCSITLLSATSCSRAAVKTSERRKQRNPVQARQVLLKIHVCLLTEWISVQVGCKTQISHSCRSATAQDWRRHGGQDRRRM